MDVGGNAAQLHRAAPDAVGQRGVVVAGDHHPGTGIAGHGGEQPADRAVRHALRIEHVAGHQHRVHAALGGQRGDARHDVKARLGQHRGVVNFELAVLPADLPVGSMQKMSHARILA
ncbi:hypothetical protein D3C72_2075620 [compost metagenome]